jgi:hypothetical protein
MAARRAFEEHDESGKRGGGETHLRPFESGSSMYHGRYLVGVSYAVVAEHGRQCRCRWMQGVEVR